MKKWRAASAAQLGAILVAACYYNTAEGQYINYNGNTTLSTENYFPYSDNSYTISDRHLDFYGASDSVNASVLDFGGITGALIIKDNANVTFNNITLMGAGPQNLSDPSADTKLKANGLGIWPSIIVEPNTTVTFNNTMTQYYSQLSWSACSHFQAKVQFNLEQQGLGAYVQLVGNDTLFLEGTHTIPQNITDITNGDVVGTANFISINASNVCVTDPYPQDQAISGVTVTTSSSGSSFKWWEGLIIALAVVALAACALVTFLYLRHRRRARSVSSNTSDKMFPVGGPMPRLNGGPTPLQSEADTMSQVPSMVGLGAESLPRTVSDSFSPHGSVSQPGSLQGSKNAQLLGLMRAGSAESGSPSDTGSKTGVRMSPNDYQALLRARSDDIIADIELGPLLGRGSYGKVYKGRWKGAYVAIKIIDHSDRGSEAIARREGSLSTSIQHPNVVTTYSISTVNLSSRLGTSPNDSASTVPAGEKGTDGTIRGSTDMEVERAENSFDMEKDQNAEVLEHWMVLEYCDRGNLDSAISAGRFLDKITGAPDLRHIYRTLLDIAGGMDYLHSIGVLHGDLKGANVLLKSTATDPRGFTCKLADFGMSRVLETNKTHVSTHTYGTVSYMPPELLKEGKLTRAADVYSFGVIMWELYSNMALHEGMTMAQVFYMVCYEQHRPPVPEDTPPEYVALLTRCWEHDPTQRPTFSYIMKTLMDQFSMLRTAKPPAAAATITMAADSLPVRANSESQNEPAKALPTPPIKIVPSA